MDIDLCCTGVAQLVERRSPKPLVAGSSPVAGATLTGRSSSLVGLFLLSGVEGRGCRPFIFQYAILFIIGGQLSAVLFLV